MFILDLLICLSIYVFIHVCIYSFIYVLMYVCICSFLYLSIYVLMYFCIHVFICMFIDLYVLYVCSAPRLVLLLCWQMWPMALWILFSSSTALKALRPNYGDDIGVYAETKQLHMAEFNTKMKKQDDDTITTWLISIPR